MSETTRRCQRDADGYRLPEHQADCRDRFCPGCIECTHDEAGNPIRHCGVRWRCTSHLGPDEHACPRCLGMIRRNLSGILNALAAMPEEAAEGSDSALSYAGPSAHPDGYRVRMLYNDRHGLDTEDYDQLDPWAMLGVRERMIREDLGHDQRILTSPSLGETCAYLDWVLTDLARDEQQTIVVADLLAETSRLRSHLEAVLRDSRAPEKGAPCPECPPRHCERGCDDCPHPAPRLVKRWAHYCDREDCDREHDTTGARDTWQCPRVSEHWWSEADYRMRISDDYLANADALTAEQIEAQHGIKASTVRAWASKEKVRKRGKDQRGRMLYDVEDTRKLGSREQRCS